MSSIDDKCRLAKISAIWNQWFKEYHRPKVSSRHVKEKSGKRGHNGKNGNNKEG